MKNPIATITMDNGGKIVIQLCPNEAPNTVNSFIYLAKNGCFDSFEVQRIVPGYVVDISYRAFGNDKCKYLIANEAALSNTIEMEPGVIAMGGYENGIAGGEFFFPLDVNEKLTGNYPVFGKISKGMDIIRQWEKAELVPVKLPEQPDIEVNKPLKPIVIKNVRVETFGVDYPEPVKLENAKLPENWNS